MSERNLSLPNPSEHENDDSTNDRGRIIEAWQRTESDGTARDMFTIAVNVEGQEQELVIPQDTFETMYRVANPEPLPPVDRASLSRKELQARKISEKQYKEAIENRLKNVTYCAMGAISAMGYKFEDFTPAAEQVARLVLDASEYAEVSQQED